ncbi:MAG: tetratricopeptide repeat protein [Bacteroides sp.]|nr:tetratricopeptide repeat protein [Bacteroides sp.]
MLTRIYILVAAIVAFAGNGYAESLTEKADSAYMADDFQTALELYQETARTEGTSAELWYNIGNTEYRLGHIGKAIIAYNRSLRLDPGNPDTRANLDFVSSKTIDKPSEKGSFLSNTTDSVATTTSADTWAWLAFGMFVLMLGGIALYVFSTSVLMRKTGFFSAIGFAIATVGLVVIALRASSIATSKTEAIVTAKSTILSTSPREPKDRTEEAMLLHEGTNVSIVDSVGVHNDTTGLKWYDVKIDNTHRAWIKSSDIEKI